MRIRTASDLVATLVAWLPFLALFGAITWVLAVGVLNLETRSLGSELFVKNSQTSNLPEWANRVPSQEDRLLAALESGDTSRMVRTLDAVEREQAGATKRAAAVSG